MKTLSCIFAAIPLMAVLALPNLALYNATHDGAMVNICLHVVDSSGNPVPHARLRGGLQTGDRLNDFLPIEGITNANGDYIVHGKCTRRVRCGITKQGYYPSEFFISYPVKDASPQVIGGKWQPYGEERTVVLKEIRDPGKLCAFPDRLRSCRIPEFNKWLGFDLECCDWHAPYGKGLHNDVLLKFEALRSHLHDYRYVMEVSFTNNPYAGAYIVKKDKSSKLVTEYAADSNATYKDSFSFVSEQAPGKPRHWDFLDAESYLVFRTRTSIDVHGRLTGAHYGKVLGRWLSDDEFMILSDGCFNPVENDVGIEDSTTLRDVLRNLDKGR